MNNIKNPLILHKQTSAPLFYKSNKENYDGEYVDKILAEEMLEALEDYRDFLITGVSGVSSEEICELISKAKGE